MNSALRASIAAEARKWLGTPYQHQARLRGVGCDCIGLVIGVAHALGLSEFDVRDYGETPDPAAMWRHLAEQGCEPCDVELGAVLLFRFVREPQHFGIVVDDRSLSFVHAWARPRAVVQSRLDRYWAPRLVGAWRMPGVT